jgi:hypothetical protein
MKWQPEDNPIQWDVVLGWLGLIVYSGRCARMVRPDCVLHCVLGYNL